MALPSLPTGDVAVAAALVAEEVAAAAELEELDEEPPPRDAAVRASRASERSSLSCRNAFAAATMCFNVFIALVGLEGLLV